MNPYNTVFDAKRLIGRKFADQEVQSDMKHWPFKIIDRATKPYIQVQYRGEEKTFVSIGLLCPASAPIPVFSPANPSSRPRRSLPWSSSR
jgi:hypothetical protein